MPRDASEKTGSFNQLLIQDKLLIPFHKHKTALAAMQKLDMQLIQDQ